MKRDRADWKLNVYSKLSGIKTAVWVNVPDKLQNRLTPKIIHTLTTDRLPDWPVCIKASKDFLKQTERLNIWCKHCRLLLGWRCELPQPKNMLKSSSRYKKPKELIKLHTQRSQCDRASAECAETIKPEAQMTQQQLYICSKHCSFLGGVI